MSKNYNSSGPYAWGTVNVLFSSGSQNGNTFITDEFETTEPTWVAERKDNVGNPNGFLGGVDPTTGRATLQIANANVVAPQRFDEFSVTLRTGANANVFVVTQVGMPHKARDFDSVPIEFREKI